MFDSGRLPQARDQQWRLLQVEVKVRWRGRLGRQAAALAREREQEAEEASRRDMRDNAIPQDVTSRKW